MKHVQYLIVVALVAVVTLMGGAAFADTILDADVTREASEGATNVVVGLIVFALIVLAVLNRNKIKAWIEKIKEDKGF